MASGSGSALVRLVIVLGALTLLAVLVVRRLYRPPPPPGRLVIRTFPVGARVTVDGTFRGVTPDTGLVVRFTEAGDHHLSLARDGYRTDTSTVYLGLDEVLELDVEMKIPGMSLVRGGVFEMGTESGDYNEKPAHQVMLSPFYIDRAEVRVSAFRRFRPGYEPPFPGEDFPAVDVSWADAQAYCRSVGKRLPTEAEWERACRGVHGTAYSYGDAYDSGKARTGLDMKAGPLPVGSFRPGNGRLYDMTGNVWEWCADWYARDAYRTHARENPRGPDSGTQHVLRGGSWYSNARYARCTHRPGNIQKAQDPSFGFRCVKDVE